MVLVGRIGRPHGIRGHVFVTAETDFVAERFAPGATVWVESDDGGDALTVATFRIQGGRPVVSLDGRPRIEDVERLTGRELRVPESMLPQLGDGAYYQHQLVGCVVETTGGDCVGIVTRVDGGVAGSLLVIDGGRGEILVPFAVDICVAVDVAKKSIRIQPPDGLLELNEPRQAGPRRTRPA